MDKIDKLLDVIEHPENYSSEEIDSMLQDPEIKEVFNILDKTKSSIQPINIPDIEDEWEKFKVNHRNYNEVRRYPIFGWLSRNIAASVAIGIVSFGAISAVVGVGIHSAYTSKENMVSDNEITSPVVLPVVQSDTSHIIEVEKVSAPKIVVFDNETLETILTDIASYYKHKIVFRNNSSKSLRLYYRWDQSLSSEKVVERLNNFEQIHIAINDSTITIN